MATYRMLTNGGTRAGKTKQGNKRMKYNWRRGYVVEEVTEGDLSNIPENQKEKATEKQIEDAKKKGYFIGKKQNYRTAKMEADTKK